MSDCHCTAQLHALFQDQFHPSQRHALPLRLGTRVEVLYSETYVTQLPAGEMLVPNEYWRPGLFSRGAVAEYHADRDTYRVSFQDGAYQPDEVS